MYKLMFEKFLYATLFSFQRLVKTIHTQLCYMVLVINCPQCTRFSKRLLLKGSQFAHQVSITIPESEYEFLCITHLNHAILYFASFQMHLLCNMHVRYLCQLEINETFSFELYLSRSHVLNEIHSLCQCSSTCT